MIIELENMEFYAFHGCYETEQIVGNTFYVSLSMEADLDQAAQSDNIGNTINYLEVYNVVRREMEITSHILENVAMRLAKSLRAEFALIKKVSVKVSKMHPPLGGKIEKTSVLITL